MGSCSTTRRCAAAESVSEAVIAAICLLETKSVDEIVAKLTTVELEQVIKIVGRCPRCYPSGAYDALKARRPPSPTPQSGERITTGPERSHRSAEQTKPATKHTQGWMPPRRFAGFGANAPLSASQHATVNPYGITLDRTWTEWATKQGLSETVAAALYLISENRKTDEVVVKLRPSEIARVIAFHFTCELDCEGGRAMPCRCSFLFPTEERDAPKNDHKHRWV
jgi:hypothetical protein